MELCATLYPTLRGIVDVEDPLLHEGRLGPVRDHVVALAHEEVQRDLSELRKKESDSLSFETTKEKEHILTRLKRLSPGGAPALSAVMDAEGQVVTDPGLIMKELKTYW